MLNDLAEPRFATPRNLFRPTLGAEVNETAAQLGKPLSRWQRFVADTAYELNTSGDLQYRKVVLSVGRQQGKSYLSLCRHLDRALNGYYRYSSPQITVYTAQTRQAAAEQVTHAWYEQIAGSPIEEELDNGRPRKQAGSESLSFSRSHGRILVQPSNEKAGHGLSNVGVADIDEAWSHKDDKGYLLEQGLAPTQLATTSPQLWVSSTAGASAIGSPYWYGTLEAERARIEANQPDSRVAFFEWAAPDDADPSDPQSWSMGCPAMGETITQEAIAFQYESMPEDDFARSILNQWRGTLAQLIDAKAWLACRDTNAVADTTRLWLAVDASPLPTGGVTASIAFAGWVGNKVVVELIENAPGLSWVADRVREITRAQRFQSLTIDGIGPANSILPDLRAKSRAPVEVTDATTLGAACGRILQGVLEGSVLHRGQAALDAAVAGAGRRQLLDGFAFSRRHSSADLSPLIASTLAHWQAAIRPTAPSLRIM